MSALNLAASYGHTDVVRELIAADGSVDHIREQAGATPLFCAAREGHTDIVRELIAADGSAEHIRMRNQNKSTALICAAREGHTDIVRALIAADDSVEHIRIQDSTERTALICVAAAGKYADIARELIAADGSLEHLRLHNNITRPAYGRTALGHAKDRPSHFAAFQTWHPNEEIKALLLAAGAAAGADEATLLQGIPPVHPPAPALILCVREGRLEDLQALIRAGADLDERDYENGYTALMLAGMRGQVEIVQLLLRAGAAADVKSLKGEVASGLAHQNVYPNSSFCDEGRGDPRPHMVRTVGILKEAEVAAGVPAWQHKGLVDVCL